MGSDAVSPKVAYTSQRNFTFLDMSSPISIRCIASLLLQGAKGEFLSSHVVQ